MKECKVFEDDVEDGAKWRKKKKMLTPPQCGIHNREERDVLGG